MDQKEARTGESEARAVPGPTTLREMERAREDQHYVPVIVKRTDEARRHPDDILRVAIAEGLEQLNRPPTSLFLSAIGAGLIVSFSAMAVAVMSTITADLGSQALVRVGTALVYPLGFTVCLMSGVELFTEHTATAVYPVLDQRSDFWRLLRLWLLVGSGNLLGTLASAVLLTMADEVIGARRGYLEVGRHLVDVELLPLLASALLAGWLMALGAWLILATPPTVSQLMSIYTVTFLIGLGGLHHSIAGSAEMLTAYLIGDGFTLAQSLRFIGWAMIGNLVGGGLFVAGLNYAHIRKSRVVKSAE
jgi:formate/nitrite transporter FocA (FNT family)